MRHKTVLLHEVIEGLAIVPGDIVIDGTLGGGGHSEAIGQAYHNNVQIIGLDLDEDALVRAKSRLDVHTSTTGFYHTSFRHLDEVLKDLHIQNVDKIILDLGLSSNQFEDSGRGFTFQKDEPLLMTFKKNLTPEDLTAREIVNTWAEENIADIIYGYGEERYARRIARAIVERRSVKPIETTFELVEIINSAVPASYRRQRLHPATKTFQALRITVNDEIASLKEGMQKGFDHLERTAEWQSSVSTAWKTVPLNVFIKRKPI